MLAKILMCSCYAEQFHEEENEYVKNSVISTASVKMSISFIFLVMKNTHMSLLKFRIWNQNVNALF